MSTGLLQPVASSRDGKGVSVRLWLLCTPRVTDAAPAALLAALRAYQRAQADAHHAQKDNELRAWIERRERARADQPAATRIVARRGNSDRQQQRAQEMARARQRQQTDMRGSASIADDSTAGFEPLDQGGNGDFAPEQVSDSESKSGRESDDLWSGGQLAEHYNSVDSSDDDFVLPSRGNLKRQRSSGPRSLSEDCDADASSERFKSGDIFNSRRDLRSAGVHRDIRRLIVGNADVGAVSIILSDAVGRIVDKGETFIYTPSDENGNGESDTASLCGSNGWLQLAYERASNIRVVRSSKLRSSPYAPKKGMRFDGTYHVRRMEHVRGEFGDLRLQFTFQRDDDQPALSKRNMPDVAPFVWRHGRPSMQLTEHDDRPKIWAPQRSRRTRRDIASEYSAQASHLDAPPLGPSTNTDASQDLEQRLPLHHTIRTVRRAARGFPKAGVIGSPSATRFGSVMPSEGYLLQGHHWRYWDGATSTPPRQREPRARRRLGHGESFPGGIVADDPDHARQDIRAKCQRGDENREFVPRRESAAMQSPHEGEQDSCIPGDLGVTDRDVQVDGAQLQRTTDVNLNIQRSSRELQGSRPILDISAALLAMRSSSTRSSAHSTTASDWHGGVVASPSGMAQGISGGGQDQLRESRTERFAHRMRLMPHRLLCHFCLQLCTPGSTFSETQSGRPGGVLATALPAHIECATCRDVVCAGCIRQLFTPSVSEAQLCSLIQALAKDISSTPFVRLSNDDVCARAGEAVQQTQLRLLRVFLEYASGRWICPKCDGKCACQMQAHIRAPATVHERHASKHWPCPAEEHIFRQANLHSQQQGQGIAVGLTRGCLGSVQSTLNLGPSTDSHSLRRCRAWPAGDGKRGRRRGGRRHGGERNLNDVAERLRKKMRVTSERMEKWLQISVERVRQRQEQADRTRRQLQRSEEISINLLMDDHGTERPTNGRAADPGEKRSFSSTEGSAAAPAAKRRKGQPIRDAATLRILDSTITRLPPPRLPRGWRLASLAPSWHATVARSNLLSEDSAADSYADAIREHLNQGAKLLCLISSATPVDATTGASLSTPADLFVQDSVPLTSDLHDRSAKETFAPQPSPSDEVEGVSDGNSYETARASAIASAAAADFLEAKAAAARGSALEECSNHWEKIQSLVERAMLQLPSEAIQTVTSAIIASMPAFPSVMAVVVATSATTSENDQYLEVGRAHLQIRWLSFEWLSILGPRMDESSRKSLWTYAGGVIDDLLPLFLQTPHASTFHSTCARSHADEAAQRQPVHTEAVDRPLLAVWHRLQQCVDMACRTLVTTAGSKTTPFWALLTDRLMGQGRNLRVVARSISRELLDPEIHVGNASIMKHTWISVQLSQLQQVRWRQLCLASLLPIYSLDAQGIAEPDGICASTGSNWMLIEAMLRESCLNPKQAQKLGYGASEDSKAAAIELLRLCCDLSTAWAPNFDLALDIWKWSPPPNVQCSSARADHRLPPLDKWRKCIAGREAWLPTQTLDAAMWAITDDCRLLALRFLTIQMLCASTASNETTAKRFYSRLITWADCTTHIAIRCPSTHQGLQTDSMRRRGCVDDLWSRAASILLAAEVQRGSPTSLNDLARLMARMLPLDGSSLCACYIKIEVLLQLFCRVQDSGGSVATTANLLADVLLQLSRAVGAIGPSVLANGESTHCEPSKIDGADELLLYLLEKMVSVIVRVAGSPPSTSTEACGEAKLLCEALAKLAMCPQPHLCTAALRVVEAAVNTASLNPLDGETNDAVTDNDDDDFLASAIVVDDAKMLAAQKVSQFRQECRQALISDTWRSGQVLSSHFAHNWSSRIGDKATRRRLFRDVIHTWARIQAFVLRDLPSEKSFRELSRQAESLLKEDALNRFDDSRPMEQRGVAEDLYELRAVPMRFWCCLLEEEPSLRSPMLSHLSEELEALWLGAMVESVYVGTRYGQRHFTRALLSAVRAHAAPAAPVLMSLLKIPDEMLATPDNFRRIDVLSIVIDDVATRLCIQDEKVTFQRIERLLRVACRQMVRCTDELAVRANRQRINTETLPVGAEVVESECKQYAYFACWFASSLLEKVPKVVLANDGRAYEWLVNRLILPSILPPTQGKGPYPALRKEVGSRLREFLILITRLAEHDRARVTRSLDVICLTCLAVGREANRVASRREMLQAFKSPSLADLAQRQLRSVLLPRLFLPVQQSVLASTLASRVAIAFETLGDVLRWHIALVRDGCVPLVLRSLEHERNLRELIIPSLLSALIWNQDVCHPAAIFLALRIFELLSTWLLPRPVVGEGTRPDVLPSVLQHVGEPIAMSVLQALTCAYSKMLCEAAAHATKQEMKAVWVHSRSEIDEHRRLIQAKLRDSFPTIPRDAPNTLPTVPPTNLPADRSMPHVQSVKCLHSLLILLSQPTFTNQSALIALKSELANRLQLILDKCDNVIHWRGAAEPNLLSIIRSSLWEHRDELCLRQTAPSNTPHNDRASVSTMRAGDTERLLSPNGHAAWPVPSGSACNKGFSTSAGMSAAMQLPPTPRYAEQLKQLSDMGFANGELNFAILMSTGGVLERAVARLAP